MPWLKHIRLLCAMLPFVAVAQPTGQSVISGTVIEGSSGDPVRKAIVTLTWQGTPRSWATTRTDGSGEFKFEGLPPGKYSLRASKTGVGSATYGASGVRELGDFIELADGETRQGLKLRFIRFCSISGHVVDSDGDPIVGLNVTLQRPGRNRGERVLLNYRNAMTKDRGEYRLGGLDPGQYYLFANPNQRNRFHGMMLMEAEEPAREILIGQFYPGARELTGAQLLTLRDGESLTGFDFHLSGEHAIRVSGHVTGVPNLVPGENPDQPLNGPFVEVGLASAEEAQTQLWNSRTTAQGPEFAFEFPAVQPGRYRIEAVLHGKDKTYSASQLLELHQGSAEVNMALSPAADLKGTLRIEGPNADPLSSFSITLTGVGRETLSGQVGADGRFTIPQARSGEWAFGMTPPPRNIFIKSVHLGDKDVRFKGIPIEPGSDAQLNIVLSTRTATIEGEVDGAVANSKRAGILLAAFGKYHTLTRFYYSAVADDHGKFKITGIAPGTYKIFALEKVATGSYHTPEAADKLSALGEDLEIAEGDTLQLHPKLIAFEKVQEALDQ